MLSFSEDDTDYVGQLAEFVAIPSVSRDAPPETCLLYTSSIKVVLA